MGTRDSGEAAGTMVRVVCQAPGCGRTFWRWPSYLRGRVFCDTACAGAALRAEWAAGARRVSPLMPGPRGGAPIGSQGGRAVPVISRPRLAARQRALEATAWCRTPRPGEGRAPTTAG